MVGGFPDLAASAGDRPAFLAKKWHRVLGAGEGRGVRYGSWIVAQPRASGNSPAASE
jgi:hypothetical protein